MNSANLFNDDFVNIQQSMYPEI
jgi:hypothetical protein